MEEPNDVLDFALKLLTERYESGYYYYKPEPAPASFEVFFKAVHDMSLEEALQLVENHGDTIKLGNRSIANEIKSMKSAYSYRINEVEEYDQIEYAVKEKNARVAWRIISNRSSEGYEYEGFSTEHIENLKNG